MFKSRIISVITDNEGKIALINWICPLNRVGRFKGVQTRYISSNREFTVPVGIPVISVDNRVQVNGYSYLGYGTSVYTDVKKHHVADPLGNIQVFLPADFRTFVFSVNKAVLYLNYEKLRADGVVRVSTTWDCVTNVEAYSNTDLGIDGNLMCWWSDVSIEPCYWFSLPPRNGNTSHEGITVTKISLAGRGDRTLVIPDSVQTPLIVGYAGGINTVVCLPDKVHTYGLWLLSGRNTLKMPSVVYRDAALHFMDCDFCNLSLDVPFSGDIVVMLSNVTGLKSMHLRYCGGNNLTHRQVVDIQCASVEELIIDYVYPNVLRLSVERSTMRIILRDVKSGRSHVINLQSCESTREQLCYENLSEMPSQVNRKEYYLRVYVGFIRYGESEDILYSMNSMHCLVSKSEILSAEWRRILKE